MKLHFEPDLCFQRDAIEAVCDLFRGQELCRTEFTVTRDPADRQMRFGFHESDLGIGNRLTLLDDELHENLKAVQLRNGLPISKELASGDFTVEMETGTGKTYVYLRTIFELNRRFGFTKFVIVVPSVAIKEGVYKALQMTEDHFRGLYAGVPYEYFQYDSANLNAVRGFATSASIQIMVITVASIRRAGSEEDAAHDAAGRNPTSNVIYRPHEKTGGERPIDLLRACRPVLIIDEPQSVDGGMSGQGRQALAKMNPLCALRYSATHVDRHHMVYRLDAIDAYERKLVKQIEVAGATVEHAHNRPFVRLIGVQNRRNTITARVELDVETKSGVQRKEIVVHHGDDLEQTTGRALYADFRIGEIRVESGNEFMELRFPGGERYLKPGEAWGDVDPMAVQREMIRRTIKEHLDKEKRLRPMGIKVLSLFFIDQVDRYRQYDGDGNVVKGEYARIFEEEYKRWARHPDYNTLFGEVDLDAAAAEVHEGYFSIDRKGGWVDTEEGNQTGRDNAERAYNLIMKEKERLLSFETPLKFIFSHSALREGWDNPNVFQICTLRDIRTERERRQSIGRGLRICVDQHGQRVRGFEVNTLTVVATESYESFAENLQREIEEDTGIRFGIVERHEFARIAVTQADGTSAPLGAEESEAIWEHLRAKGYLNAAGKVQDALRTALKEGTLELPDAYEDQRERIEAILRKRAGRLEVKDADKRRTVSVRKEVLVSESFQALWDRIRAKTTYRVQFGASELVDACVKAVREAPPIATSRLQWRKADLAIGKGGIDAKEKKGAETVNLTEADIELPDVLTVLQDQTRLTRRSIQRILVESGRLRDFLRNPQDFIKLVSDTINRCKRLALVDGIKYQRLGDAHYYSQELFESAELTGYLRNLMQATKSIHEQVIYDSDNEKTFAEDLEHNDAVKLYVKLPGWFVVPTPLGGYNPDWAVLIEQDGTERLYFVVETKSKAGLFDDARRVSENEKIRCAKVHFTTIARDGNPARFEVVGKVDDLMSAVVKP